MSPNLKSLALTLTFTMALAQTCILPTVPTPAAQDPQVVAAAINQWNTDVLNVNNFLNQQLAGNFNDPAALLSAAQGALQFASDEPCQLATLGNAAPGFVDPAFNCAQADLARVFGDHVLANLNAIIANPADTAAVINAVADINFNRCCNVLSDASILWTDAAQSYGLVGQVNTQAPLPNACASIGCTQACAGLT